MIDKIFIKKHINSVNHSFIFNQQNWSNIEETVCLVLFHFDESNYSPSLFRELGIYFPEEIKESVGKRQSEFLAGRYAAYQTMLKSGIKEQDIPTILIGKNRSPKWPKDFIGSISHTKSMAVCAFTTLKKFDLIGVDLEYYMQPKVAAEVSSQIYTHSEKAETWNQYIPDNIYTTLIFSAKESLFKSLSPYIQSYFGFESAQVIYIDFHNKCLGLLLSEELSAKHNLKREYNCLFQLYDNYLFTYIAS